jgi:hypothetical protein
MAYGTFSTSNFFKYTRNYNVSALTVSIWAYPTSFTAEQTLCGLWGDPVASRQWLIGISNTSKMIGAVHDSSTRVAIATANTSANAWMHAAIVFNGSTLVVYQNGSQVASVATGGTLQSSTDATGIGARQGSEVPCVGNLAEFATWTRALSLAEIQSLADGFKPSRIPTPDIYYPLVREKIDVRNNYTLTTVGSPAVTSHPRIY